MSTAQLHLTIAERYWAVTKAVINRNRRSWMRFKPSFYMELFALVVDVLLFILLGGYLSESADSATAANYVGFLIVGLAFSQPMANTISACYESMSLNYWAGRLEAVLLSEVPVIVVVVADVLWSVIRSMLTVAIYLCIGWFFGLKILITPTELLLSIGLFLWGIPASFGIGLISASMFTLINAKGFSEPIGWLVSTLQRLVSGVYFPASVLPKVLLGVSWILPQTHIINLSRRLLLDSSSGNPRVNLVALLILTPFYLALGWQCFSLGLRKARETGDLSRWT